MPSTNAIVLIGYSRSGEGNSPYAGIAVRESGRFFGELYWVGKPNTKRNSFLMLLDPYYALDDLIVMSAYTVSKTKSIVSRMNEMTGYSAEKKRWVGFSDNPGDLNKIQRQELYEIVKGEKDLPKLTFSIFAESALPQSIKNLEKYSNLECEVTRSVYRNSRGWGLNELSQSGDLNFYLE